jgi:hypothetical protein
MEYSPKAYERKWRDFDFVWDGTVKYTNKKTWEVEIVDRQKQLLEGDWLSMDEIYVDQKVLEDLINQKV